MTERSQEDIFSASEGDRWFERNRSYLESFEPTKDLPMLVMSLYSLKPKSVLEVGCSNGTRLDAIRRATGASVTGVEVSDAAIVDGSARFPEVRFLGGSASAIPTGDTFDLVIINFVFHWIDRDLLFRSVAEVGRVTAAGGFIIIGDFCPTTFTRNLYHHFPAGGVFTFKQDYSRIFCSSGLYRLVAHLTAHHLEGINADVGEHDRTGVWLLKKEPLWRLGDDRA